MNKDELLKALKEYGVVTTKDLADVVRTEDIKDMVRAKDIEGMVTAADLKSVEKRIEKSMKKDKKDVLKAIANIATKSLERRVSALEEY